MTTMPPAVTRLLERDGTGISWADLTFNPWIGCTKMGPACDGCYAEVWDRRQLHGPGRHWGPGVPRHRTSPANWGKPLRWNRIAGENGVRLDVFCLSLGDWADAEVEDLWRADLARVIRGTPHLNWMLLTKRYTRIELTLRLMFGSEAPPNIVVGTTIVTQEEADKTLPRLIAAKRNLNIPAVFLSMEPLLEPIDLNRSLLQLVNLVIDGGESGPTKRHMDLDWCRSLRGQARHAGVAFHMKQLSEFDFPTSFERLDTFPADLQVRERGW